MILNLLDCAHYSWKGSYFQRSQMLDTTEFTVKLGGTEQQDCDIHTRGMEGTSYVNMQSHSYLHLLVQTHKQESLL